MRSWSWKLPRWKRSFTRLRASKSTASQPGGMLVRRSTALPLTERASHAHAPHDAWPCERPKPVIPRIMPRPVSSLSPDSGRVDAGSLVGFSDFPVLRDIALMLGVGFREDVAAFAIADKVHVLRDGRAQHRAYGLRAGIADRRRGQPADLVRVPVRLRFDLALADRAAKRFAPGNSIDDRRVALQPHAATQAVHEHRRYFRPLRRVAGLLLDDGGKVDRLLGRLERQAVLARGPCFGEQVLLPFDRPRHHGLDRVAALHGVVA